MLTLNFSIIFIFSLRGVALSLSEKKSRKSFSRATCNRGGKKFALCGLANQRRAVTATRPISARHSMRKSKKHVRPVQKNFFFSQNFAAVFLFGEKPRENVVFFNHNTNLILFSHKNKFLAIQRRFLEIKQMLLLRNQCENTDS